MGTTLKVSDNSGAKTVQCLKILKGSKETVGSIGDLIVIAIKTRRAHKKLKKKEIRKAVIVRTTKPLTRVTGLQLKFDKNYIIIVNAMGLPLATRIFGPVTYELRKKKYLKIISLASKVL